MKSITRSILTLLYLTAILICLLMVIKPGSSVFYIKRSIDSQSWNPDTGFAYRHRLEVNPWFYRTKGILVFEDGQLLTSSEGSIVTSTGLGAYSIDETSRQAIYLYLSTSDNSSPLTNGRDYAVYLPLSVASQQLGALYLLILLPGAAWFIFFAFTIPGNRKTILQSPSGILEVQDKFYELAYRYVRSDSLTIDQQIRHRLVCWKKLLASSILLAYFYIFMEWLFFVTKPSFMSILSLPEKIAILLVAGLVLALLILALVVIYIITDLIFSFARIAGITRYLVAILPTGITSTLILILVDNFTYTIFKFGIITTTGFWRGLYGLAYLVLFAYLYGSYFRYIERAGENQARSRSANLLTLAAASVMIVSFGLGLIWRDQDRLDPPATIPGSSQTIRTPNIILLGSDGVNASHMSVYGYERETTPRIEDLAQSSLVAENAFTNSSNTAGSIISIFTSKLPTQTHVVYAPDILSGIDAYQHLPGVLRSRGYSAVEYGVPAYVDAYDLNLQYGFDEVNGRRQDYGATGRYLRTLGYDDVLYFLSRIMERASERLQHIYFIRDMQNPYEIVTRPVDGITDEEKISQMLEKIEGSKGPLFIHTHLMGTHGAEFNPPIQVFSKGKQQDQRWMTDFYDDAIYSFDYYVGEVVDSLKASGKYDDSILIIYSDHAIRYEVNERIPLIMHFPDDAYSGRITQNVQNLDIAPIILDYIGLPKPEWMSGTSVLNGNLDDHRLIISAGTVKIAEVTKGLFTLDPQRITPPFYQFSFMNLTDCHRWHQLDLTTFEWLSGDIDGYIQPCDESSLLSMAEIKQAANQRLTADGFDVSSIP